MKLAVAAVQMAAEPLALAANLERAEGLIRRARDGGAELVVLPEMFNTGYGRIPDYAPYAETREGPTVRLLQELSRRWGLAIAAGFVECDGPHLYDALAFCTPDGRLAVYRKRNLVFWERSRFRPGAEPLVVATPWGRLGFAICADMIYRRVWDDYRGRIDLAIVAAAWPDFAHRETGRKHWLLGHVGPLSAEIPGRVAHDLGIPVVFANQVGATRTFIPLLLSAIPDQFAGGSCLCDGRHGPPVLAGRSEEVLIHELTVHPARGPHRWPITSRSASEAHSSGSGPP